jgi:hypothetical protein
MRTYKPPDKTPNPLIIKTAVLAAAASPLKNRGITKRYTAMLISVKHTIPKLSNMRVVNFMGKKLF